MYTFLYVIFMYLNHSNGKKWRKRTYPPPHPTSTHTHTSLACAKYLLKGKQCVSTVRWQITFLSTYLFAFISQILCLYCFPLCTTHIRCACTKHECVKCILTDNNYLTRGFERPMAHSIYYKWGHAHVHTHTASCLGTKLCLSSHVNHKHIYI